VPKKRSQPESSCQPDLSLAEPKWTDQSQLFAVGLTGRKRLLYLKADYFQNAPARYIKLIFTDIQQYRQLLSLLRARRKRLNRLGIHFGGYRFTTDTRAAWIIWCQFDDDESIESKVVRFYLAT